MKAPYGEGLASHTGSESCAHRRKAGSEALTGAHSGGVLSRHMLKIKVPTSSMMAEATWGARNRKRPLYSARSETPACMETPRARSARLYQRPTGSDERAGWRRG
jgi:hypothetical protein